jgi:hypothetical protein
MCLECCIPKATNTDSEYVLLSLFYCNNGYTNMPQFYVLRMLPVLCHHLFICSYISQIILCLQLYLVTFCMYVFLECTACLKLFGDECNL